MDDPRESRDRAPDATPVASDTAVAPETVDTARPGPIRGVVASLSPEDLAAIAAYTGSIRSGGDLPPSRQRDR